MPFRDEIVDQLNAGHQLARTTAEDLVAGYPSIVAVALVGAWARGIVSPVDMDFVVVVPSRREVRPVGRYLESFKQRSDRHLTLFYFAKQHVERKLEHTQRRASFLRTRQAARVLARQLRKAPAVKKALIALLAQWLPVVHLYEFPPRSLQTWMPVYDPDGFVAQLQESQRPLLASQLSELEWKLWAPNGFYALMEAFLHDDMAPDALEPILSSYDVDWREYLRRCMVYYPAEDSSRIADLYRRLTGDPPPGARA